LLARWRAGLNERPAEARQLHFVDARSVEVDVADVGFDDASGVGHHCEAQEVLDASTIDVGTVRAHDGISAGVMV
jgi:hypothetical protein